MKTIYPFIKNNIDQYNDLKFAIFYCKFMNISYFIRYLYWDEWQFACVANASENFYDHKDREISISMSDNKNIIKDFLKMLIKIKNIDKYDEKIKIHFGNYIIIKKKYNELELIQDVLNHKSSCKIRCNNEVYNIFSAALKYMTQEYTSYIRREIRKKFGK